MAASGFLIIDKPVGMTSRKVDNLVGEVFHTRAIGHLGTLDPFASGMLLLAVNSATKCLNFVEDGDKRYVATLRLFEKTETGDTEGEVIDSVAPFGIEESKVREVLSSFLGKSSQIPPMTSAIKVEGEALYKKARRGESVEREPRPIEIHGMRLLAYDGREITFAAHVSKGTYIRVLGEDIASALGTVGYLTSLRRISIGNLSAERMVPLSEIEESKLRNPMDLIPYPHIEVNEEEEKKIRNGMRFLFPIERSKNADRVLLVREGNLLAAYERTEQGEYRCLRGLFHD